MKRRTTSKIGTRPFDGLVEAVRPAFSFLVRDCGFSEALDNSEPVPVLRYRNLAERFGVAVTFDPRDGAEVVLCRLMPDGEFPPRPMWGSSDYPEDEVHSHSLGVYLRYKKHPKIFPESLLQPEARLISLAAALADVVDEVPRDDFRVFHELYRWTVARLRADGF